MFDYMVDQGVSYGYVTDGQKILFLREYASAAQMVYYHCQTIRPDMFDDDGDDNDYDEMLRETAVELAARFTRLAIRCGKVKGSEWIKQTREALPAWIVHDETKIANFPPSLAAAASKDKKAMRSRSPAFRGKGPSLDGGPGFRV